MCLVKVRVIPTRYAQKLLKFNVYKCLLLSIVTCSFHTEGGESECSIERKEDLDVKVAAYERSGYINILGGVLLNVLWIVPLMELRNDITYVP